MQPRSSLGRILNWLVLVLLIATPLRAYVYSSHQCTWAPMMFPMPIPMQIKVGTSRVLSDGTNFSTSAQAGMQIWNGNLGVVQFLPQIVSEGGQVDYDNDIYFDATIEGEAFGTGVLAVTLSYRFPSIRELFEADIIFNTAYTWDSYRGPLQTAQDFQRVVTHELGHVLGLSHPDEYGQSVTALMNSHVSNLDTLAADDIAGAQSLYRAPGQTAAPVNDNFASATTIGFSSGSLQVYGNSYYATKEAGEPDHDPGTGTGGASLWWKWTAPSNATVSITTANSHFDTLLGVYTGAAVNALTAIAVNDDTESGKIQYSTVTFAAAAGTTYYIAVDGWNAFTGDVVLNLNYLNVAPSFSTNPTGRTITVGQSTQFGAVASGTPNPTYQWQRMPSGSAIWANVYDGGSYSGTASTTLTVSNTTWSMNGDTFRCVASNVAGSAISLQALLQLNAITPTITSNPASGSFAVAGNATFTMAASGVPAPNWRWQRLPSGSSTWSYLGDGGTYTGVSTTTLTINNLTLAMSGDQFRGEAYNAGGSAFTNPVTLTVFVPLPVITQHPVSQGVLIGSAVNFSVTATSPVALTYKWQKDGTDIPGATSSTLTIPSFQLGDIGNYRAVVSNSAGSVNSNAASLAVAVAPTIVTQPQAQSVYTGMSVTFSVTATSNATQSYAWLKNGAPIGGATQSTYTISPVQMADAAEYSVVVSNVAGSVTSAAVQLTVTPSIAPVIVTQPVSQSIYDQASASFSVAATGLPTPTYQWQVRRVGSGTWADAVSSYLNTYAGAQTPNLVITGSGSATSNGEQYRCVVSNVAGTVTSNTVTLSVGFASNLRISAGRYHSLRLNAMMTASATGVNTYGQLGTGSTTSLTAPATVTIPGQSIAAIAAGAQHSLFLTTARELWTCGFNANGQLGDGTLSSRAAVSRLATNVVGMAAAVFHSAFIKADGTLWTMGGNDSGQLGDGTLVDRSTPVQVATGVMDVALGNRQSFYLKSDGTLWGMGDMNGSGTPVSTPVQVTTNVRAMAAGAYHSLILKQDGTLWTLGYNSAGQLGTGDTTDRLAPVQIATDVRSVTAGYFFSAYIKNDGSLWTMGNNGGGQLGAGDTTNRSTAAQRATSVASLSAGENYLLFVRADGSLWATGYNANGQFGNGTTSSAYTPLQLVTGVILPPENPAGLTATPSAALDRMRLTWTPQASAITYEVWRNTTNDSGSATLLASGLRWPVHEDLTASLGQAYYYWLKAVNSTGTSGFSTAANAVMGSSLSQTITFAGPADQAYSATPVTLSATSTSGLAVVFSLVSGPASLSGDQLTLTGVGSVTIRASQAGNASYSAATPVDRTFTVGKAAATVTLGSLTATYDGSAKSATASTTPNGLTVTLTYDGGATAPTNAGSYAVVGTISDPLYQGSASGTLLIAPADQTITFGALSDVPFSSTPITLTATASSGLPVTFSLQAGNATLVVDQLTLTGIGSVTVRAAQSGDANYNAAPNADRSFTVAGNFASWGLANFSSAELLDAAISGPNADPDGDGFSNLLEYALGLDPRTVSTTSLPEVSADASDWIYTYVHPADRTDVTIAMEASTDLSGWGTPVLTPVLVSTVSGVETWQAKVPLSNVTVYFRLKVTQ